MTTKIGQYEPATLPPIPGVDPREGRLPGWARTLLASTRGAAEVYQAAAKQAQRDAAKALFDTNPTGTNTLMEPWGTAPVGLPDSCTVHFRVGAESYFNVSTDGARLQILGSAGLVIDPAVSNHLRLWIPQATRRRGDAGPAPTDT